MIKAIFFDIDGTLISHTDGKIPQSTIQALHALHEKGIKLFVSTGRHPLEMQDQNMYDLPFDGYVTLNGQLCLDADQNTVYSCPISDRDVKSVLKFFKANILPIMIVEKDDMYLNFANCAVRHAQKEVHTPVPNTGKYTDNEILQFTAYGSCNNFAPMLDKLVDSKMTFWNPRAIDIIPKTGGKAEGMKQMLKAFHIEPNEIMAFGDGANDIDMLQYANIGVAMGNAHHHVKDKADYVTSHIDQMALPCTETF